MTPEELMQIESYLLDRKKPDYELSKMIMEACEKQIPKVVGDYRDVEDGTFYNIDFMCPACGCAVIGQPYKPGFCKHCGQALDWSDTE